jgi:hypothetical protein
MAFLGSGYFYFGGYYCLAVQVYMFTSWTSWVSSRRLKFKSGYWRPADGRFGSFLGVLWLKFR